MRGVRVPPHGIHLEDLRRPPQRLLRRVELLRPPHPVPIIPIIPHTLTVGSPIRRLAHGLPRITNLDLRQQRRLAMLVILLVIPLLLLPLTPPISFAPLRRPRAAVDPRAAYVVDHGGGGIPTLLLEDRVCSRTDAVGLELRRRLFWWLWRNIWVVVFARRLVFLWPAASFVLYRIGRVNILSKKEKNWLTWLETLR